MNGPLFFLLAKVTALVPCGGLSIGWMDGWMESLVLFFFSSFFFSCMLAWLGHFSFSLSIFFSFVAQYYQLSPFIAVFLLFYFFSQCCLLHFSVMPVIYPVRIIPP